MRLRFRNAALTVLLIASVAGCTRPADEMAADTRPSWAEFANTTIAEYYRRNPETAVNAGLHEYDGRMRDLSIAANEEYLAWLRQTEDEIEAYAGLKGIEEFERQYLLTAIAGETFDYGTSGFIRSNPIFYTGHIGTSVYLDREYAALEVRLAAFNRYIAQLPSFLETMKSNPAAAAGLLYPGRAGIRRYAVYLRDGAGIFSSVDDEKLQAEFRSANTAACSRATAADWLGTLKDTASDNYALGEQRFLQMLRAKEGVEVTIAELKAAGERDLQANLAALDEACAEYAPGSDVKDCVLSVQNKKPEGGAVEGARRQLPLLRKFLEDNKLVSIPGTEDALVDEAPPHRRFNAAYISIPGPYESGLPSTYYIAPADPEWSEEDQRAYVPGETSLLAITVHESLARAFPAISARESCG
jgi:hypothetical protein